MNLNSHLLLRNTLLISAFFILVTVSAYWLWIFDSNITTENGLLESGQDIFLLLACLMNGFQYKKAVGSLDKYLRMGLMLFCFAMLLREFDIDKIGISHFWETVETVTRGATLIAFLTYLVFMQKRFRLIAENLREIIAAPMIIFTIPGCVTYICGWPFDKLIFVAIPVDLAVFIEEVLELNATLLFFFASCASGLRTEKFMQ